MFSEDSLVHSTDNLSALVAILKSGFKVSICREEFTLGTNSYEIGVPVISFSDISRYFLHNQQKKYGCYGILLSKDWAFRNGLNPVLYMNSGSSICNMIEPFLVKIEEDGEVGNFKATHSISTPRKDGIVSIQELGHDNRIMHIDMMISLLSFIKNYEGTVNRSNGEVYHNYRFYDEHEWRFVPGRRNYNDAQVLYDPLLSKAEYNLWRRNIKNPEDRFIPGISLDFRQDDIIELQVTSDEEKVFLINSIQSFQEERYDATIKDKIKVLNTKDN